MRMLVYTTIALVAFLVSYGIDLGGEVSALIFLTVLLIGAGDRVARPYIEAHRG